MYELDDQGNEVPADGGKHAKTITSDEIYPCSKNGAFYPVAQTYAKNRSGSEMYIPVDQTDGFIINTYAKDSNGNEYYPLDANGESFYISNNYAKNSQGHEMYRVNKLSREIALDRYISNRYPKDENGTEYYALDAYLKFAGQERYAVNNTRVEYYRTNSLGNQVYARGRNGQILAKCRKLACYEKSRHGSEKYPTNDLGDEYYLVSPTCAGIGSVAVVN